MKHTIATTLSVLTCTAVIGVTAQAATIFSDGFETPWSGDYAPGWVNSAYRHGTAPVGKMMQQTTLAHSGTYGLQLTAASTPADWMWWASVSVETLPATAMEKQYNPWVSVYYYDSMEADVGGQLFAVPDWVNLYIPPGEDWTDVQFGARFNQPNSLYYFFVAAGETSPGWISTGVQRSQGWHNLKMQLSSSDGKIHFFVDNVEVGTSYRSDYTNLGTELGLYTMFNPPLSAWETGQTGNPYTIWDDFQVGSDASVPEAGCTLAFLATGLLGLAGARRWFKRNNS